MSVLADGVVGNVVCPRGRLCLCKDVLSTFLERHALRGGAGAGTRLGRACNRLRCK